MYTPKNNTEISGDPLLAFSISFFRLKQSSYSLFRLLVHNMVSQMTSEKQTNRQTNKTPEYLSGEKQLENGGEGAEE